MARRPRRRIPDAHGRTTELAMATDLTVAAIPGYFGTMGAEYAWLRRRAETGGLAPHGGDADAHREHGATPERHATVEERHSHGER